MKTKQYFFTYFLLTLFLSGVSLAQQSAKQPFFKAADGMQWLSTDLHIHTVFSDGSVWPSIRVEEARREGLDLIAMTEHLEYQPHSEDIPHPDRNRSYAIASDALREGDRLEVINGSEITRDIAPSGHFNAVFIQDANALLHKDSLIGILEANKQNAFVFWNHPNWDKTGIARLEPFQQYLVENKLLQGIEVVNETTYSEEAFQIALDHNLTLMGGSDIHGLTEWSHGISSGGHRPMTFVSVPSSARLSDVKQALFEGKTVVWHKDIILGKKAYLVPLIKENLVVTQAYYPKDKTLMQLTLSNHSAMPFELQYVGAYSFHEQSDVFRIPAGETLHLKIKTVSKKERIELPFLVLNALTAPKEHPKISWEAIPQK